MKTVQWIRARGQDVWWIVVWAVLLPYVVLLAGVEWLAVAMTDAEQPSSATARRQQARLEQVTL